MTAQPGKYPAQQPAPTFVIAKLGDGYRVYAPDQPHQIYLVSGTPESPQCTCPEFRSRTQEPEASCDHIEAVFRQPGTAEPMSVQDGSAEAHAAVAPVVGSDRHSPVQMLLKRSISPDGRIDSLSIEFSCSVESLREPEIRQRAMRLVTLQQSIAGDFNQNGGRPKQAAPASTPANGVEAAQLVSVGGMDGKWGRRLFLVVQIRDRLLKFFGSEKQLTEALGQAGFAGIGRIGEGMVLNIPCRVTTKPSPDGRYQNIERILPVEHSA